MYRKLLTLLLALCLLASICFAAETLESNGIDDIPYEVVTPSPEPEPTETPKPSVPAHAAVHIYLDLDDNEVLHLGDKVTLKSELIGLEDFNCTYKWEQYILINEEYDQWDWRAIDGATGPNYSFKLTKENSGRLVRLVVSAQPK